MTSPPENDGYAELLARVAAERGLDFEPPPAPLVAALPQLREHVGRLIGELEGPVERRWLAAALAALAAQVEAGTLLYRAAAVPGVGPQARAEVAVAVVVGRRGVLVGRRRDGIPRWVFPGGTIEHGETSREAAVRECAEETGVRVRGEAELGRRQHPATGRVIVYIACRLDDPEAMPDAGASDELDELEWLDPDELAVRMPDLFEPVRRYVSGA